MKRVASILLFISLLTSSFAQTSLRDVSGLAYILETPTVVDDSTFTIKFTFRDPTVSVTGFTWRDIEVDDRIMDIKCDLYRIKTITSSGAATTVNVVSDTVGGYVANRAPRRGHAALYRATDNFTLPPDIPGLPVSMSACLETHRAWLIDRFEFSGADTSGYNVSFEVDGDSLRITDGQTNLAIYIPDIQDGIGTDTSGTNYDMYVQNDTLYLEDQGGILFASLIPYIRDNRVFHKRLTFGDSYTLPIEVLDTSDIISIYGGAFTGSPVDIIFPTLPDTSYDGKIIYVRGSSTELGTPFRITSPDSTDILRQGCSFFTLAGPDTIRSSTAELRLYIISSGRYYNVCDNDFFILDEVVDTNTLAPREQDFFITAAQDTIGMFIDQAWRVFAGGGGIDSSGYNYSFEIDGDSLRIIDGQTNFAVYIPDLGVDEQDLSYDAATGLMSITNGVGDTVNVMVGATSSTAGQRGLVPQPQIGQDTMVLFGDGMFKPLSAATVDGDDWGNQVAETGYGISGDGTLGDPLVADTATLNDIYIDNTDTSGYNVSFVIDGDSLRITDGQTSLAVYIPDLQDGVGTDTSGSNYSILLNGTDLETTDQNGTIITDMSSLVGTDSSGSNYSLIIQNDSLKLADQNGTLIVDLSAYLDNTDTSGYNTSFVIDGDSLRLTDGNTNFAVYIPDLQDGIGTDTSGSNYSLILNGTDLELLDQNGTLTADLASLQDGIGTDTSGSNYNFYISNDSLYIQDQNGSFAVILSPYLDNTDTQDLSIDSTGTTIIISLVDGGQVQFEDSVDDADADPTNEYNTSLTLNGTDLELVDGGGTLIQDLASLVGTDTSGSNYSLVIENDSLKIVDQSGLLVVDLSAYLDNTDDQGLTYNGLGDLDIENGTDVDLSDLLDNTDTSGYNISFEIDGDSLRVVDGSTNLAVYIPDLQDGIGVDTSGSNYTLTLNGTQLELTDQNGTLIQDLASLQDGVGVDTSGSNYSIVLNGTDLEVTDQDGTIIVDLLSLVGTDTSGSNYSFVLENDTLKLTDQLGELFVIVADSNGIFDIRNDGNSLPAVMNVNVPEDYWLQFDLNTDAGLSERAIRVVTPYSSDDAVNYYLEGHSPLDSFAIYNFDGGVVIDEISGDLRLDVDSGHEIQLETVKVTSEGVIVPTNASTVARDLWPTLPSVVYDGAFFWNTDLDLFNYWDGTAWQVFPIENTDTSGYNISFEIDGDSLRIIDGSTNLAIYIPDLQDGIGLDTSGSNYSLVLNGTVLELTDQDGTLTEDLASLQDGIGLDTSGSNYNLIIENDTLKITDQDGTLEADLASYLDNTDTSGYNIDMYVDNDTLYLVDGNDTLSTFVGEENYGDILFVAENGNNATAEKGNYLRPWKDPWAAAAAADSSDQIQVLPGRYIATTLTYTGEYPDYDIIKNSATSNNLITAPDLQYYLFEGAEIINASTSPLWYDNNGYGITVLGRGKITIRNDGEIAYMNSTTGKSLIFEAKEIVDTFLTNTTSVPLFELEQGVIANITIDKISTDNFVCQWDGTTGFENTQFNIQRLNQYRQGGFYFLTDTCINQSHEINIGYWNIIDQDFSIFQVTGSHRWENTSLRWNVGNMISDRVSNLTTNGGFDSHVNEYGLFAFDWGTGADTLRNSAIEVNIDQYFGNSPLMQTGYFPNAYCENLFIRYEGEFTYNLDYTGAIDDPLFAPRSFTPPTGATFELRGVFRSVDEATLISSRLNDVTLIGEFTTVGSKPVLQILDPAGGTYTLLDAHLFNDGSVPEVSATTAKTVYVRGAWVPDSTDSDVTFIFYDTPTGGGSPDTSGYNISFEVDGDSLRLVDGESNLAVPIEDLQSDSGGGDDDWRFEGDSTYLSAVYRLGRASIGTADSSYQFFVDGDFAIHPDAGSNLTRFKWEDGDSTLSYSSLFLEAPSSTGGSSFISGSNHLTIGSSDASIFDREKLGAILFGGYESSTFYPMSFIESSAVGNWNGSSRSSDLNFWTTNGLTTQNVMTLQSDGRVELDKYETFNDGVPESLLGFRSSDDDMERHPIAGSAVAGAYLGINDGLDSLKWITPETTIPSSFSFMGAFTTTTSNIASSGTFLSWDTPYETDDSVYTVSGEEITLLDTALYQISFQVAGNGAISRNELTASLHLDEGSGYSSIISTNDYVTRDGNQDDGAVTLTYTQTFNGGDKLKLYAISIEDSGVFNVSDTATYINIMKIEALQGEQGPAGPAGSPGADGDITWEGAWSAGTYLINQAVENDGSAWVCTAASTTEEPGPLASDWDLMASKGDVGGVEDDAYGSGWDGDTANAPSQNAVYDYLEKLTNKLLTGNITGSTITLDMEGYYNASYYITNTGNNDCTLTINNEVTLAGTAPVYNFHFSGMSADTDITFPSEFNSLDGTDLGTITIATEAMVTCYGNSGVYKCLTTIE